MFTPFHAGDRKSNIKVSAGLSSLRKLHVPLASGGLPRLQPHASIPASVITGRLCPCLLLPGACRALTWQRQSYLLGPKHQPHLSTSSCMLLATGRLAHARYGSRHWGHSSAQSRHPHPLELKVQWGQVTPSQQEVATLPLLLPPAAPAPPLPPPGAARSLCPCVCLLSVSTSVPA